MTNEDILKFINENKMPCVVKIKYTMELTPGGRGKHVIEYEYEKKYKVGGDYRKTVNRRATIKPVKFGVLKGAVPYSDDSKYHMLLVNNDNDLILQVFEIPGEKSHDGKYFVDGHKASYAERAWIEELREKQKTDYNSKVQSDAGIDPENQVRPRSLLVKKIEFIEIAKD